MKLQSTHFEAMATEQSTSMLNTTINNLDPSKLESFKGRSARKSTAAKPREKTPELDLLNVNNPEVAAAIRAQRALDALQFSNPGRLNCDFNVPTTRIRRNIIRRERPKRRTTVQDVAAPLKTGPTTPKMCDCIRSECHGCFPTCKKCGSRRCGLYCQVNRPWTVVEVVIPGSKAVPVRNDEIVEMASESEDVSSDSDA